MWQTYLRPTTLAEVLDLLEGHAGRARLIAGGTDVIVELSRGILPAETLIDLSAIPNLKYVHAEGDRILLGALATHNDVIASLECVARVLPLAQACWEVGAPQIRTRATVAGNLVTASPANDTITPLIALEAELVIARQGGERIEPLSRFYHGVRRTTLQPGELLREIRVPMLKPNQRGLFLKLGLRRAQAISVINAAFVLTFDGDRIADARITLGSLAPTIVRARAAEDFLHGKRLEADVRQEAGRLACADVRPIDDVRGTASYRLATLSALVADGLRRLADGTEAAGWPAHPILLDTSSRIPAKSAISLARSSRPSPENTAKSAKSPARHPGATREIAAETAMPAAPFTGAIETTINGRAYSLLDARSKTLLNALREDAGLTGTKEGCAEGECGACTVWLNGQAVMSCLVPAAQAHGAAITTIEGLAAAGGAQGDELHPLQRAFVEAGAVQCGYCIPGMLMAGAKLLAERTAPTLDEIQIALSGNLCRCTGYRKILDAVQAAGGPHAPSH